MSHGSMLIGLIVMTFAAVIVWAVWQKVSTKKVQEQSGDPDGRKATDDALHAHGDKR